MNRLICTVFAIALAAFTGCKDIDDPQPSVTPELSSGTAAVVIGMENSFAGNCLGANLDAKRMNDLLSKYTTNVTYLTNEKATHDRVASAMKAAVSHDLCIIYYSGHGGSQAFSDTGSEETDGRDEFLCVYDRMFRDNEIWSIISKSKGRVMLIVDACHSCTMYRTTSQFTLLKAIPLTATHNENGPINLQVWSGCPDDNYSYGGSTGGEFTNCLLRHFDQRKTYEALWNDIEKDTTLQSYEKVQRTLMGDSFVAKPIFR